MSMKEFWSWVVMGIAFLTIVVLGIMQPAHSHSLWANGEEIQPWVKNACCGVADSHHLTADQVHMRSDGSWVVDGYKKIIPAHTELYSPDGTYWVFYKTFADGDQSSVYCFYIPMPSM